MGDFMCYASLAESRTRDSIKSTDIADDPRRMSKLRAATADIFKYCGERVFQPWQDTRTFDWTSNEWLGFRAFELLTLTSIVDGTNNTKQVNALIMQGGKYSDATKYGPWYACRIDTTKDFLLYNVTPFRCIQVTGLWGYYDDYGLAGANAWTPVYIDNTLAVALNGTVADATTHVITPSVDPTLSYDSLFQTPGISAGHLIQIDSEWMQVLATSSTTITVQRGANGTTAVAHSAKAISVFQPMSDIKEATLRLTQFMMRQDDAPFGKVLTPATGQVVIPYKMPPDVCDKLDRYVKRRVA